MSSNPGRSAATEWPDKAEKSHTHTRMRFEESIPADILEVEWLFKWFKKFLGMLIFISFFSNQVMIYRLLSFILIKIW